MPEIGFLIDSYDSSDKFRTAMRKTKIHFRNHVEVDNVIYIREADKKKVVSLANSMKIEWQWTSEPWDSN